MSQKRKKRGQNLHFNIFCGRKSCLLDFFSYLCSVKMTIKEEFKQKEDYGKQKKS